MIKYSYSLKIIFLSLTLSISHLSLAGTVTKNSGDKLILDFKDDRVPAVNDKVYVLDQTTHKEIGVIEIIKTKESRALGKLLKGTAKPGDSTDIFQEKKKRNEENRLPAEDSTQLNKAHSTEKKRRSKLIYGGGANLILTSMYIKNSIGEGAVNGNGFGFFGAADYTFSRTWSLLGTLGLHSLNVSATSNGYSIKNSTTYLGLEGILRFNLNSPRQGLWLGGGIGYYTPSSSNLNPKPKSALVYIGSAGYNIPLGKSTLMLKGDFILFPTISESGTTTKTYQFTLGGIYFF